MDKTGFWKVIDDSRREAGGDPEDQIELLRENLTLLKPSDIVAFDRWLNHYYHQAFTYQLWGAAYLIGGGCSDDGFSDFRGWLISRGEKFYETALADPDALAALMKKEDGDGQVEGFMYVAPDAWEQKTGNDRNEFPRHDLICPAVPTGEPWDEDRLPELFPKLDKRFS